MSAYDQQFTFGFENYPQTFEFQNFGSNDDNFQPSPRAEFYSPSPKFQQSPSIFTPTFDPPRTQYEDYADEDELPLLDELEIYPARIIEKSLAVLNPFHKKGLADDPEFLFRDNDLAGPIAFYLALAFFLFISDTKRDIFGYVYGLSLVCVLFMYVLLMLMNTGKESFITLSSVASILGYSILPFVWLSILGVFFSLNNKFGIALVIVSIGLSTFASSRIFCMMTGDQHQRYLIAYPCALINVIFTLLVLF